MKILFATLLIAATALLGACSSLNKAQRAMPEGSVQAKQSTKSKEWYCEGDENQQWRCSDLSQTDANIFTENTASEHPVSETPATNKPPIKQASIPATETASTAASIESPDTPVAITDITQPTANNNPLQAYADDHYAVQLIAAKNLQTIDRYKQQHPQLSPQSVITNQNGQRWYLLLLGVYPSYAEANAAIAAISPAPTNNPWIRPLGALKASLKTP